MVGLPIKKEDAKLRLLFYVESSFALNELIRALAGLSDIYRNVFVPDPPKKPSDKLVIQASFINQFFYQGGNLFFHFFHWYGRLLLVLASPEYLSSRRKANLNSTVDISPKHTAGGATSYPAVFRLTSFII